MHRTVGLVQAITANGGRGLTWWMMRVFLVPSFLSRARAMVHRWSVVRWIITIAVCLYACMVARGESVADLSELDHRIFGVASITAQSLLEQAILYYKLVQPNVTIEFQYGLSSVLQPRLFSGYADIAVMNSLAALSTTQMAQYPDIMQFPFFSQQTAVIYNTDLPDTIDGAPTPAIAFSVLTLSKVFSAQITRWNDSAIQAENPLLAAHLPDLPIQMVLGNRFSLTGQDALCTVFYRVNSGFASRFPCTSSAFTPPKLSYGVPPILGTVFTELVAGVATHKWSLGFASVYQAALAGLLVADIINLSGHRIVPSRLSAQLPMMEVGFPLVQGKADLTLASGPFAYPFTQYIYLQVSKSLTRATCETAKHIVSWLLWLYTDNIAASISAVQASPILPPSLQSQLSVPSTLKSNLVCLPGKPIYSASDAAIALRTGKIAGLSTLSTILPAILQLYTQYDPGRIFSSESQTQILSYELINTRTEGYNLAIVSSPEKDDDTVGHLTLPFAVSAVRILYSPPAGLTLDDTGPIILDVETLGQIYGGLISSWLHPRVARMNERLTKALQSNPSINPNITVILCCTVERGTLPGSNILRQVLESSQTFGSLPIAKTHPLEWGLIWSTTKKDVAFKNIDYEKRTSILVKQNPGSIGYGLMDSSLPDDSIHVRLLPWKGSTDASEPDAIEMNEEGFVTQALNRSIQATPSSILACSGSIDETLDSSAFDLEYGFMDWTRSRISSQCWPISMAVQILIPPSYTNVDFDSSSVQSCSQGLQTLQFLRWLISSPLLSSAFQSNGFVRVTDLPKMQEHVIYTLESILCDGRTLLIFTPQHWMESAIVPQLTEGWSTIGFILVAMSALFLLFHRQHSFLRQTSLPLLWCTLLGLTLTFISAILWTSLPFTQSKCSAFHWTLELGFTLTFTPIVLKIYRVDRLLTKSFNRDQQRLNIHEHATALASGGAGPTAATTKGSTAALINRTSGPKKLFATHGKLTDGKMLLLVGIAVLFDCILLGIMQSSFSRGFILDDSLSQTQSTDGSTTDVGVDAGEKIYTHCNPGDSPALLGVLLSVKGVWILAGTLMTLGHGSAALTPNVMETKQQAYALFNLLLSTFIIVPLSLLLNVVGDALMLLILILVLWTSTVALACVFGPKIVRITFQASRTVHMQGANTSALDSYGLSAASGGGAGGAGGGVAFGFLALKGLARDELMRYMQALDKHIIAAKNRLVLMGGLNLLQQYRAPIHHDDASDDDSRNDSGGQSASRSHTTAVAHPGTSLRAPALKQRTSSSGDLKFPVSQVREHSVRVSLSNNFVRVGGARDTSRVGAGGGGIASAVIRPVPSRASSPPPGAMPLSPPLPSAAVITVHRPDEQMMPLHASGSSSSLSRPSSGNRLHASHTPPPQQSAGIVTIRSALPTRAASSSRYMSRGPYGPTSPPLHPAPVSRAHSPDPIPSERVHTKLPAAVSDASVEQNAFKIAVSEATSTNTTMDPAKRSTS